MSAGGDVDCEEILDMLRFPDVYSSFGSKMPRGYVNSHVPYFGLQNRPLPLQVQGGRSVGILSFSQD